MVANAALLAALIVTMTAQRAQVSAAATQSPATPVDDSSLVSQLITPNTQVVRVKVVGVSA